MLMITPAPVAFSASYAALQAVRSVPRDYARGIGHSASRKKGHSPRGVECAIQVDINNCVRACVRDREERGREGELSSSSSHAIVDIPVLKPLGVSSLAGHRKLPAALLIKMSKRPKRATRACTALATLSYCRTSPGTAKSPSPVRFSGRDPPRERRPGCAPLSGEYRGCPQP